MKRLNPATGEIFKKGDIREDGRMFLSYGICKGPKKDGFFSEHWVNPESFNNCNKAISKHKKQYSKTMMGTTIEILGGAKWRAREKQLPFDLDLEFIRTIVTETCPVFQFDFSWNNNKQEFNSPTLDRIIPELGYVKGNVRIISNLANSMKNSATFQQMHQFADLVKENVPNS